MSAARKPQSGPTPLATARDAYPEGLPEWIEALAIECARTSQKRVADKMNRSAAMISTVLSGKYKGSLAAVEEVFKGVFQEARIECPALGIIPTNVCQDWRRKSRSFVSGNPLRVSMFRACNRCPRNQGEVSDA